MLAHLLGLALLGTTFSIPLPQRLTEAEFKAKGRSLALPPDDISVFISPSYSQVRRQGGRAFNDPISFPTLTVRSPNDLPGDASKQVAANPTGPVFNVDFEKELQDIKLKIDEVNQLEKERLDQLANQKAAAPGGVIQEQLEEDAQLRAQLESASLEAAGLESELADPSRGSGSGHDEDVAAIREELIQEAASLAAADAALNELAADKALDEMAVEMAINEIANDMALNQVAEELVMKDIQAQVEATKAELAANPEMTALEKAANEQGIDEMMAEIMAAEAQASRDALVAEMMAEQMAAADMAAKEMAVAELAAKEMTEATLADAEGSATDKSLNEVAATEAAAIATEAPAPVTEVTEGSLLIEEVQPQLREVEPQLGEVEPQPEEAALPREEEQTTEPLSFISDIVEGSGSQILPEFESVDLNEIPEASSQTSEALSEQLKLNEQLMTTVVPAPAADHMFMIEEVPPRSTQVPLLLTEPPQPLTDNIQHAAATEAAHIPVTERISPAIEEEPTQKEELPVPTTETTAVEGGEESAAALRDVPTPSVDFGLIQEVTGVLREESASS